MFYLYFIEKKYLDVKDLRSLSVWGLESKLLIPTQRCLDYARYGFFSRKGLKGKL